MELITFITPETNGRRTPRVGALINNEFLLDFARACEAAESPTNHLPWLDMDSSWFQKSRRTYDSLVHDPGLVSEAVERGWLIKRSEAYWLAPVPRPGKIICVGLNYRDHAAESNMPIPEKPVIFSKYSTTVTGHRHPIVLPKNSSKPDYEAEFAVVIGQGGRHIAESRWREHVFGYTILNDVSAR